MLTREDTHMGSARQKGCEGGVFQEDSFSASPEQS